MECAENTRTASPCTTASTVNASWQAHWHASLSRTASLYRALILPVWKYRTKCLENAAGDVRNLSISITAVRSKTGLLLPRGRNVSPIPWSWTGPGLNRSYKLNITLGRSTRIRSVFSEKHSFDGCWTSVSGKSYTDSESYNFAAISYDSRNLPRWNRFLMGKIITQNTNRA